MCPRAALPQNDSPTFLRENWVSCKLKIVSGSVVSGLLLCLSLCLSLFPRSDVVLSYARTLAASAPLWGPVLLHMVDAYEVYAALGDG